MNSGKREPLLRGPTGIWRALRWSFQGLRAAWRLEAAFRLEVCLFVVFAPLGGWLGTTPVERVLLIGSWLLLIAGELFNSALEAAVDRWGPERHELIGRAKDMASATVLVLALNLGLCWALLLLPRLLAP